MSEPIITSPIVKGTDLILDNLANKIKTGRELNSVESGLGVIAANAVNGNKYAPDITQMKLNNSIMPEVIQSAIINAIG